MEPWGKQRLFRHRRGGGEHGRSTSPAIIANPPPRTSTTSPASSIRWTTSISSSVPWSAAIFPIRCEMDFNTCYAGRRGHHQACRHRAGCTRTTSKTSPGDAAHDRRRRGQVAGAAVRQPVQLLRRAAPEVRPGRLPLPGGGGPRRHAGAAALGRPGGRHRPGGAGRGDRAGSRRVPRRPRLRERHRSPARRRSSAPGASSRTCGPGAMSGGSPEQALLSAACAQMAQFYDLTGGTASGHDRCQDAGRAVRLREGVQPRAGRQCRRQPDLRIGRHAGEPARLLAGEPADRQRHHRRRPAHHQGHRGHRRFAVVRDHQATSAWTAPATIWAPSRP